MRQAQNRLIINQIKSSHAGKGFRQQQWWCPSCHTHSPSHSCWVPRQVTTISPCCRGHRVLVIVAMWCPPVSPRLLLWSCGACLIVLITMSALQVVVTAVWCPPLPWVPPQLVLVEVWCPLGRRHGCWWPVLIHLLATRPLVPSHPHCRGVGAPHSSSLLWEPPTHSQGCGYPLTRRCGHVVPPTHPHGRGSLLTCPHGHVVPHWSSPWPHGASLVILDLVAMWCPPVMERAEYL